MFGKQKKDFNCDICVMKGELLGVDEQKEYTIYILLQVKLYIHNMAIVVMIVWVLCTGLFKLWHMIYVE